MAFIGMVIGALAGLFVAGPLAWVITSTIFGEGSFANNFGWLGWGAVAGILFATIGGSHASSVAEKFRREHGED